MPVKDLPYERYDAKLVEEATEKFLQAEKDAKCVDDVLKARDELLKDFMHFFTMSSLAYTRYTLNTYDKFYLDEQAYYDEAMPIVGICRMKVANCVLNSRFKEELKKALPETLFPLLELESKCHSPETVEDEKEENSIVTEYSQLMSQLTTDWQGEKKTISYIRGFFESPDREMRKAAANAIGRVLESVSEQLDDIYDRLVKVRTRIAKKLGFKDFVELGYCRMGRIDYNREMVAKFRENVLKDLVPVVSKFKAQIQKELGLDEFKFYDDSVIPGGNPVPKVDAQGILDAARDMYDDMHPEASKLMRQMLSVGAIDPLPRDGKWGGGYATTFEDFHQTFILGNFTGMSDDIDLVTHEFGHTFAMNFAFDHDTEAGIGSSETAETHSMSMEFFAWKYLDKFFDDVKGYKFKHLGGCLSFIPYGVIVDEFQHVMYEHPELTPAERKKVYLDLEKKYRPYLNFDGIEYLEQGTRWQYQMHIYEMPFYYIDYCLAQVVALEFLSDSQKDYADAFNRYVEHCKRGGLYAFNHLVKLAGLKSPFEDGALKEVASTTVKLLDELKK
ncbi:MAG: M3 family oligoendopeptidase [Clostridia bacterium]|nr:M3 family oligoendopeptidase [Clostridia bacterium]